jgi:hypothetical protein
MANLYAERLAFARWPRNAYAQAVATRQLGEVAVNDVIVRDTVKPFKWVGIGVTNENAGAASELVNVAHQLGGSLGLGILVVVFAAAGTGTLEHRQLLAHQIATAITGGGVMLVLALVLVVALIIRPWTATSVDPHVCECLA